MEGNGGEEEVYGSCREEVKRSASGASTWRGGEAYCA